MIQAFFMLAYKETMKKSIQKIMDRPANKQNPQANDLFSKEKSKQRNALIREGNAAFNEGDIEMAARIFKTTVYKDGLIRVGDYYYFEKHQPLLAYGYYRKAGHQKMLDKIFDGFTFALKCWLWEGEGSSFDWQGNTSSNGSNGHDDSIQKPTQKQNQKANTSQAASQQSPKPSKHEHNVPGVP